MAEGRPGRVVGTADLALAGLSLMMTLAHRKDCAFGRVAEWSNAPVLKVRRLRRDIGRIGGLFHTE